MASMTLGGWPSGAAVDVYAARTPSTALTEPAPLGTVVVTGTASSSGVATFRGLAVGSRYVASDGSRTVSFFVQAEDRPPADVLLSTYITDEAGDESTDYTEELQAAFAAIPFGGRLLLDVPGTFVVSDTLVVPEMCVVEGLHRGFTMIKQADGANLDAVIAAGGWLTTDQPTADYQVHLREFAIDANRDQQSSGEGHGLVLWNFWSTVVGVDVYNARGDGIRLSSARRDGTESTGNVVEVHIRECAARECTGAGIRVYDPDASSDQTAADGFIRDCLIQNVGGDGIRIDSGAGWLVDGAHTYGVGRSAIRVDRGLGSRVTGNYCESFGLTDDAAGLYCGIDMWEGLLLSSATDAGAVIADNTVIQYDPAGHAGTSLKGIAVRGSAGVTADVAVTGNVVKGPGSSGGGTGNHEGVLYECQDATSTLNVAHSGNLVSGWPATLVSEWAAGGTLTRSTGTV